MECNIFHLEIPQNVRRSYADLQSQITLLAEQSRVTILYQQQTIYQQEVYNTMIHSLDSFSHQISQNELSMQYTYMLNMEQATIQQQQILLHHIQRLCTILNSIHEFEQFDEHIRSLLSTTHLNIDDSTSLTRCICMNELQHHSPLDNQAQQDREVHP